MDEKLLELARKGDVSAQVTLAEAFLKEGNLEEAYKWAKEASKQDSDQAELMLGYFYHHGLKVEQDLNKAKEWYKKAPEQGFPPAMEAVAYCYEHGLGVTQNAVAAELWYNKAKESKE